MFCISHNLYPRLYSSTNKIDTKIICFYCYQTVNSLTVKIACLFPNSAYYNCCNVNMNVMTETYLPHSDLSRLHFTSYFNISRILNPYLNPLLYSRVCWHIASDKHWLWIIIPLGILVSSLEKELLISYFDNMTVQCFYIDWQLKLWDFFLLFSDALSLWL